MSDHDLVTRLNAALEGRYRIESELGEGGMATVYLADDIKHERKVALKVLKPELAAVVGAERFLAEIKTTANLSHPHILPLHDSGEADSFLFYVMPYVEGESLRERLDREQQLPVDDAVRIATNVAEALDYAHRQGVIHRDIKPANLMLQDGKPVISDFGIALAVGVAGGGRLTETGLSLGTPHYMSPEQATGDQSVGPATDIYALGCVLYEMLVGEPPFTGSTPQAVLGKIITGETPSVVAARPSVPPNVDAAVRKTLEKVPADRFTDSQDLAAALADSGFRYGVGAPWAAGTAPGPWNALSKALAGLLVVSGVLLGLSLTRRTPGTETGSLRVPLALPEGQSLFSRLPTAAISPDGQAIVYVGQSTEGIQLHYRRLDQLDDIVLRGTSDRFLSPFFSPDGEWIGFYADNSLKRIRVSGGTVETISVVGTTSLQGTSWSKSDTIYFTTSGVGQGVQKVPASGGTPEPVTMAAAGENHWYPSILPGEHAVLYTLKRGATEGEGMQDRYSVAVSRLADGARHILVEGAGSPQYVASGHLLYARLDGSLYAVPFDPEALEITGSERRIIEGLLVSSDHVAAYSVSGEGRLLYVRDSEVGGRSVVAVRFDGEERPLEGVECDCNNPTLSPDGELLAVGLGAPAALREVRVYELSSGTSFPVTADAQGGAAFWRPPNSGRISFLSGDETHWAWVDRRSPAQPVPHDGLLQLQPGSWSPDGTVLVFPATLGDERQVRLYLTDTDGDRTPRELTSGSIDYGPKISPDGRWLAYQSRPNGPDEVYVLPFPAGGNPIQVTRGGGRFPIWAPDMSELYYRVGSAVFAVEIATEPSFGLGEHRQLFDGPYNPGGSWAPYDIRPDGDEFIIEKLGEWPADMVLVTNFLEELKRLVPN